jgi:hypothetical protein
MKVGRQALKRIIKEEISKIYENRAMPDIAAAIDQNKDTMDLVEIINEIGALVAQNHYTLTLKYDMGSMDLAGDVIAQFEEALAPYMNDYFGEESPDHTKLGKTLEWLDEAIREELDERQKNVY